MSHGDPDQSELSKEAILELFYTSRGSLDDINRAIDSKLAARGFRKITLFEEFIKNRLAVNPRILKMPQMEISAIETVYLKQYPALGGLEIQKKKKNFIGDEGLEAISLSTLFSNLRQLDLRNNGITRLGMKVLGESKGLSCLEKIDLRTNKLGKRWEDKLRETGNFPKLIELKIA
jgi:hypothetical protein